MDMTTFTHHLFLNMWTRDMHHALPFANSVTVQRALDTAIQAILPGGSAAFHLGTRAFCSAFLLGRGMTGMRHLLAGADPFGPEFDPPDYQFEDNRPCFALVPVVVRSTQPLPSPKAGSLLELFGVELDHQLFEALEDGLQREVSRATLMTLDQVLAVPFAQEAQLGVYTDLLRSFLARQPFYTTTPEGGALGYHPREPNTVMVAAHSTRSFRRAVPGATADAYRAWRFATLRFVVTIGMLYGITVRHARASAVVPGSASPLDAMAANLIDEPWLIEATPVAVDEASVARIRLVSQSIQGQTNVRWHYYLVGKNGRETRTRVYYVLHPGTDGDLQDAILAEAASKGLPLSLEAELATPEELWV